MDVRVLANQKQKEKYADAKTVDDVIFYRYNYLYTDAYDENGWDEEKLNEHAAKYIDLSKFGLTD